MVTPTNIYMAEKTKDEEMYLQSMATMEIKFLLEFGSSNIVG